MPRYIDADAFDDTVQKLNEQGWHITRIDYKRMDRILFEMPTVDVVKVVRCKDCKHYTERQYMGKSLFVCNVFEWHSQPNDYCSFGERKEDARNGNH